MTLELPAELLAHSADIRLQTAMALCGGFEAYPDAPAGSQARWKVARRLEAQGDAENAAKLLKQLVDTDPFGREAPEALSLLAKIVGRSGRQPATARQFLKRLCTDYYLFDPVVSEAREEIGFEPLSPRNMILLDVSLGEASTYDRSVKGSCGFGQYEVIQILSRRGFKVHTNERGRRLAPEEMPYYGLGDHEWTLWRDGRARHEAGSDRGLRGLCEAGREPVGHCLGRTPWQREDASLLQSTAAAFRDEVQGGGGNSLATQPLRCNQASGTPGGGWFYGLRRRHD